MKPQPPVLAITMSSEKKCTSLHMRENRITVLQTGDFRVKEISAPVLATS